MPRTDNQWSVTISMQELERRNTLRQREAQLRADALRATLTSSTSPFYYDYNALNKQNETRKKIEYKPLTTKPKGIK